MRTTSAGASAESWRFPIVDTYSDGVDYVGSYPFNQVTFVVSRDGGGAYHRRSRSSALSLNLDEPIPLRPITDTPFHGDDSHPEGPGASLQVCCRRAGRG